jgi:hypothetical protein
MDHVVSFQSFLIIDSAEANDLHVVTLLPQHCSWCSGQRPWTATPARQPSAFSKVGGLVSQRGEDYQLTNSGFLFKMIDVDRADLGGLWLSATLATAWLCAVVSERVR